MPDVVSNGQVLVEYVGLKPQEVDGLYGTEITWVGRGDQQWVPLKAWAKMKKHTDVWRAVQMDVPAPKPQATGVAGLGDAPPVPAPTPAPAPAPEAPTVTLKPVGEATEDEMRAALAAAGKPPHPRLKPENLQAAYAELLPVKA